MARILVVDDLESEAFRMICILEKAGHTCERAHEGDEAVKLATAQPPALILMDVVMGDQDGFGACRRLKRDPATRDIPVVFVTSKSDESSKFWAEKIGAASFLVKPVLPQHLIDTVERILAER